MEFDGPYTLLTPPPIIVNAPPLIPKNARDRTMIQMSAWTLSRVVNKLAVTSRNRKDLKVKSHFGYTVDAGAIANNEEMLINTRNMMISTVTALTGKRFGSRATTQPIIVATKMHAAHGIVNAMPP